MPRPRLVCRNGRGVMRLAVVRLGRVRFEMVRLAMVARCRIIRRVVRAVVMYRRKRSCRRHNQHSHGRRHNQFHLHYLLSPSRHISTDGAGFPAESVRAALSTHCRLHTRARKHDAARAARRAGRPPEPPSTRPLAILPLHAGAPGRIRSASAWFACPRPPRFPAARAENRRRRGQIVNLPHF